jgi:hypothetical protein
MNQIRLGWVVLIGSVRLFVIMMIVVVVVVVVVVEVSK